MEFLEANTVTGGLMLVRPTAKSRREASKSVFQAPKSKAKTVAVLPRKPDQPAVDAPRFVIETIPGLTPLTLLEDENAVDANIPTPKKRKKAADDDEFEDPGLDVSRASSLDDSKYLEPEESKYKKAKTFEPSEEVAENLKDVTGLDESVKQMLITANPRLQVYLGLREYTPGGLRKTDLMEPIVKSVDLSNFAESQAYKENKSKDGKLSRLCKPFESASYYENQAELRGDVRTTKPYNREGLKEKPLEDLDAPATPVPENVRRSKRAKNTRATQKMLDNQAMLGRDEKFIFEDEEPPASPFFGNIKPLSKNLQTFSTKEAQQRKNAERAERARLRKEAKELPPLSPIPNPQRSDTPRPATPPPLTPLLQQQAPSVPVANAPQRAPPRPRAKPTAKPKAIPKAAVPVRTSGRARKPVAYQDAPSPVQTKKKAPAVVTTRTGRVSKPRK